MIGGYGVGPLLLASLIMGFAGWLQGATGFGFAIVAMALLPLPGVLGDFQVTFPLVALNGMVIPLMIMSRHRKEFWWRKAMPLAAGGILGTVLGFWLMDQLSGERLFVRLFGATLVVFALVDLGMARVARTRMPGWMGVPCGVLGGFFGGAFNIGGPPYVVYVYSQPWSKAEIVATLQVAFLVSTGLRLVLMGGHGYFDGRVIGLTLWTLLPTAVGIGCGTWLLHRADAGMLRAWVFGLVALLGIKYLCFPG